MECNLFFQELDKNLSIDPVATSLNDFLISSSEKPVLTVSLIAGLLERIRGRGVVKDDRIQPISVEKRVLLARHLREMWHLSAPLPRMGQNVRVPSSFFSFSINSSDALILPPLDWASIRGYTFCAWIYLDSSTVQTSHPRVLFRFVSSKGFGVEAYIKVEKEKPNPQVVVQSRMPNDWKFNDAMTCSKTGIELDSWHFITVCHTLKYLSKSRAMLFVDGELKAEHSLNYPEVSAGKQGATFPRCVVGEAFGGKMSGVTLHHNGTLSIARARKLFLCSSTKVEQVPSSSLWSSRSKTAGSYKRRTRSNTPGFVGSSSAAALEIASRVGVYEVDNSQAGLEQIFSYDPRTCVEGVYCKSDEHHSVLRGGKYPELQRSGKFRTEGEDGEVALSGSGSSSGAEKDDPLDHLLEVSTLSREGGAGANGRYARLTGAGCATWELGQQDLKEVLECVGLNAFLLLLPQLFLFAPQDEGGLKEEAHHMGEIAGAILGLGPKPGLEEEEEFLPQLLAELLLLLGDALHASEAYRAEFLQISGFGLVSWVLKNLPVAMLTETTVQICFHMLRACTNVEGSLENHARLYSKIDQEQQQGHLSDAAGAGDSDLAALLFREGLLGLLLEMEIWNKAPKEVQVRLFHLLQGMALEDAKRFRLAVGIPNLLQVLESCTVSESNQNLIHHECLPVVLPVVRAIAADFHDSASLNTDLLCVFNFIVRFPGFEGSLALAEVIASTLLPLALGISSSNTGKPNSVKFKRALKTYDAIHALGGVDWLLGVLMVINSKKKEDTAKDVPTQRYREVGGKITAAMFLIVGRILAFYWLNTRRANESSTDSNLGSNKNNTEVKIQQQLGILLRWTLPKPPIEASSVVQSGVLLRLDKDDTDTSQLGKHELVVLIQAACAVVVGDCAEFETDPLGGRLESPWQSDALLALPHGLVLMGALLAESIKVFRKLGLSESEDTLFQVRIVVLKLSMIFKSNRAACEQALNLPGWASWFLPLLVPLFPADTISEKNCTRCGEVDKGGTKSEEEDPEEIVLARVTLDLVASLLEHAMLYRSPGSFTVWHDVIACASPLFINEERTRLACQGLVRFDDARVSPASAAIAKDKAETRLVLLMRTLLELVWARTSVHAVRENGVLAEEPFWTNLSQSLMLAEEKLLWKDLFRLRPFSVGGSWKSSSFSDENSPKFSFRSVRFLLDGRPDTKWVDLINTNATKNHSSWVYYRYPKCEICVMKWCQKKTKTKTSPKSPKTPPFVAPGEDLTTKTSRCSQCGHRVVYYEVTSAMDRPELDPPGWTLLGRRLTSGTCGSDSSGDPTQWTLLDRRGKVRFSRRNQKKGFWAQTTGVFDEYRLVFDPSFGSGLTGVQDANGVGIPEPVAMQLGQVKFFQCDATNWHHDISIASPNLPSTLSPECKCCPTETETETENENETNTRSMKFIAQALKMVSLVRLNHQQTTEFLQCFVNLVGHALPCLNASQITQAVDIVQHMLERELSQPSDTNRAIVLHLLHALQNCLVHSEFLQSQQVCAALTLAIVNNYRLDDTGSIEEAALKVRADQEIGAGPIPAANHCLKLLAPMMEVSLEKVLEENLTPPRPGNFQGFQNLSAQQMHRRSENLVYVSAYGGQAVGAAQTLKTPVMIGRSARKRVVYYLKKDATQRRAELADRKVTEQRLELYWRRTLLQDEGDWYELHHFEGNSRSKLWVLDKHLESRTMMRRRLKRNCDGDTHYGASSGLSDRSRRREEAERERELEIGNELARNTKVVTHTDLEHELKMQTVNEEQCEINKQTQVKVKVKVKVKKEEQVEVGDSDSDEATEGRDSSDEEKGEDRLEEVPSPVESVESPATPVSVDEEESPPVSPVNNESTSQQISQISEIFNLDKPRKKMTLQQWVSRTPSKERGEIVGPWPTLGEEIFPAARCHMIRPDKKVTGRMIVSSKAIYFDPDPPSALTDFIEEDSENPTKHDTDFESEASSRWETELTGRALRDARLKHQRKRKKKEKRRRRRRWGLDQIHRFLLRRYHMKDCAIEIFLTEDLGESHFFYFTPVSAQEKGKGKGKRKIRSATWVRDQVVSYMTRGMSRKTLKHSQTPENTVRKLLAWYTERWQDRLISNFEYLAHVNSLAGRSFNDLTQYPVFPWVIADYKSSDLNLHDLNSFRDLSKPMGALNEARLAECRDRYRTFDDPFIPKFHYGSHYSTMAGCVLYFLVRMEPFTSLHINLQDGHLDVPDRLFNSIPASWHMCTTSMSEVKELTPEFYYLPEFLRNNNHFELGTTQDGNKVEDVKLPPWAHDSPELFVKIMRDALESDHVSMKLHLWMDLIFGCKQKGEAAVKADNVFYYLTYAGAVDMDAIENDAMRHATELQVAHFGQCPNQLLTEPHPPRGTNQTLDPPYPLSHEISVVRMKRFGQDLVEDLELLTEFKEGLLAPTSLLNTVAGASSPVAVRLLERKLVVISENGVLQSFNWGLTQHEPEIDPLESAQDLETQTDESAGSVFKDISQEPVLAMFPDSSPFERLPRVPLVKQFEYDSTKSFSFHAKLCNLLAWSADGRILASSGAAIGTVQLSVIDAINPGMATVQASATLQAHVGPISSLKLSACSTLLVSGSTDSTLRVWRLDFVQQNFASIRRPCVFTVPQQDFRGHTSEIIACAVDKHLDLLVSSSHMHCLVHSISSGHLLRRLQLDSKTAFATNCLVSPRTGSLIVETNLGSLHAFTVNARKTGFRKFHQENTKTLERSDLVLACRGAGAGLEPLLLSCRKHKVDFFKVTSLHPIFELQMKPHMNENLKCISLSPSEEALVVCSQDGTMHLQPLVNIQLGDFKTIPMVNTTDVALLPSRAKDAALHGLESLQRNSAVSKGIGMASEAIGAIGDVKGKLTKGISSIGKTLFS